MTESLVTECARTAMVLVGSFTGKAITPDAAMALVEAILKKATPIIAAEARAAALEEAAAKVIETTRADLSLAAGEFTLPEWRAALAMRSVAYLRIRDLRALAAATSGEETK